MRDGMNLVPERNSLQCHSLPFSHRMRLGDRKSLQVSLTSCWLRNLMRRKSLVSVTHILLLGGQNTWRSPESHCIVTHSLLIMQQGETIWKRLMHCDSQTIHGHDLLKHLVDYCCSDAHHLFVKQQDMVLKVPDIEITATSLTNCFSCT